MKTEKQILSIIEAACAKEREAMKAGDAAAVERLDALTTLAADIVLTPELKPSEEQPIGEEYAIEIGKDVHTLRVGSQSDINRLIAQDRQESPEVDLEKFTEKIKTFQGRYKHPEIVSIKGAMAFMARMFYQYPNVARQWYEQLPKATMD